jgi:hypothetical protein
MESGGVEQNLGIVDERELAVAEVCQAVDDSMAQGPGPETVVVCS